MSSIVPDGRLDVDGDDGELPDDLLIRRTVRSAVFVQHPEVGLGNPAIAQPIAKLVDLRLTKRRHADSLSSSRAALKGCATEVTANPPCHRCSGASCIRYSFGGSAPIRYRTK